MQYWRIPGLRVCFVYPDFIHKQSLGPHIIVVDIEDEEFTSIFHNSPVSDDIIAEIDPANTALYLHTSGSYRETQNRGTHLCKSGNCFPEAMKNCTIRGEAEILGNHPAMSHISGPIILNLLLANRCRLVIIDFINPVSLFENIAKHKITYFHAVPPIFSLMLQSGFADRYDTKSLDLIAMMGTSVPVSLMNAFKERSPHVVVLQGYGLTETSPLITLTRREDADHKRASIGTPVDGAEIMVVDEQDNQIQMGEIGELAVRGPMVMKGYLGIGEQENERFKNGYFYTSDLVKFDSDNYFYHMGRRDDLVILANGQNIYPAEIKNVIFSHPGVLDSEVIGVHSERFRGNVLHAFVVSTQKEALSEKEIRLLCQKELGSIKTPRYIHLIESIPKTSTGKTDLNELTNLSKADDT